MSWIWAFHFCFTNTFTFYFHEPYRASRKKRVEIVAKLFSNTDTVKKIDVVIASSDRFCVRFFYLAQHMHALIIMNREAHGTGFLSSTTSIPIRWLVVISNFVSHLIIHHVFLCFINSNKPIRIPLFELKSCLISHISQQFLLSPHSKKQTCKQLHLLWVHDKSRLGGGRSLSRRKKATWRMDGASLLDF